MMVFFRWLESDPQIWENRPLRDDDPTSLPCTHSYWTELAMENGPFIDDLWLDADLKNNL